MGFSPRDSSTRNIFLKSVGGNKFFSHMILRSRRNDEIFCDFDPIFNDLHILCLLLNGTGCNNNQNVENGKILNRSNPSTCLAGKVEPFQKFLNYEPLQEFFVLVCPSYDMKIVTKNKAQQIKLKKFA